MIWLKWSLAFVLGVGAVWALLAVLGQGRWQARTVALVSDLVAHRVKGAAVSHDPSQLVGLPAPVQRYFAVALTPSHPRVRSVRISHVGTFNMGEVADNWKPFASKQWVETARPGFVWKGTIRMAPGLPVCVHDAYVAGEGTLSPAILGLFPLAELRGTGDIATGELMRYLAEAAWYPTALLPGQGVKWSPLDDTSARATLTDGAVTVSLTFRFGPDGLIESVRADARGRTLAGQIIPTPWEGRWSDYQRWDGMMVPMTGEVAWLLPEGDKPYWRGKVTMLSYEFAN